MVLDVFLANEIAVVMATISVSFMIPALIYAYKIRHDISKALLIIAASKHLYKYLFFVLGSATAGSAAHLVYHIGEFQDVTLEIELMVHITIDSGFILVAVSLFLTFKTAYGILRGGKERADVESKLRQAAQKISSGKGTDKTNKSASAS